MKGGENGVKRIGKKRGERGGGEEGKGRRKDNCIREKGAKGADGKEMEVENSQWVSF